MFAYMMLGTNGIERAARFYEPLMAFLGKPRCAADADEVCWGSLDIYESPALCIGRPFDGRPATAGNGAMPAFRAPTVELVQKLYEAALNAGGTDEGAPGHRPQYGQGFYSAYVRDPDGNKLAFACYHSHELK